ncbi:MAG: hypothetical protein HYY23_03545 [Verrucomicrobia bacterium]|nr:hypothetical protein [Verrucomicrobiota bacterium]
MKRRKSSSRFVLCVRAEADADLTPRKVYEVLPDRKSSADGFLRVIDDSGEDYLYPTWMFVPISLPSAAKRRFNRATESVLDAA